MLFNISGTNGAGKTTLTRKLCGDYAREITLFRYPRTNGEGRAMTEKAVDALTGNGIVAVGAYRPNTASGGCDNINTQDLVRRAVETAEKLSDKPNVIFEGIVVSTIFKRYADWAREPGVNLQFGYLDTPLDKCLANIVMRQEASGKVREIKIDQVESKFKSIARRREKMIEAGLLVHDIPHGDNGVGAVREILGGSTAYLARL